MGRFCGGRKADYSTLNKEVQTMSFSGIYGLALTCMLSVSLVIVTCATALAADGAPKLVLKMSQEKEVTTVKDGKKVAKRVPVEQASSGDVLVYTIGYTNTGSAEARDAAIEDPIPAGMAYVVGSAGGKGTEVTCSIDGGKEFKAEPVKITVKKADGTTQEKDAEPGMYTNVRWMVKKVMPGASGKVSFKVKVK